MSGEGTESLMKHIQYLLKEYGNFDKKCHFTPEDVWYGWYGRTWLSSEIELLRFFLVRLVTRYRICQKMGDANMSPLRALAKLDATRAPAGWEGVCKS